MKAQKVFSQLLIFGLVTVWTLHSGIASARDDSKRYSISEAMSTETAKSFAAIKFYFGDQSHSSVKKSIGTYSSRRTTNAFGKSDRKACQWAFMSAVKSLYERALSEGGNAVVNIVSVTTGQPFESQDEFICRAGNFVAKVYLKGEVVVL